ncbi:MAG TPA: hypothetical protein PKL83_00875 [bacterium]|nr:hypothetical protein [bacterium]
MIEASGAEERDETSVPFVRLQGHGVAADRRILPLFLRVLLFVLILTGSLGGAVWLIRHGMPAVYARSDLTYVYYVPLFTFLMPYYAYFGIILGLVVLGIAGTYIWESPRQRLFPTLLGKVVLSFISCLLLCAAGIRYAWDLSLVWYKQEAQQAAEHITAQEAELFITDAAAIAAALSASDHILIASGTPEELSRQIISNEIGKNDELGTYYTQTLSSLVNEFSFPTLSIAETSLFYYDSVLYFGSVEEAAMEQISEELGRRLVQQYFSEHVIKADPDFDIIAQDEYVVKRQQQIAEDLAEYDTAIGEARQTIIEIENEIPILQQTMGEIRQAIAEDEQYLAEYGYDMWGRWLEEDRAMLGRYENLLAEYQQGLADWQQYLADLENNREILTESSQWVDVELGLFTPDNQIEIVLDTDDPLPPEAYLSTLVHEYLHFTSYVPEEDLENFFEEGLTEYYAREILRKSLHTTVELGYSSAVDIIQYMEQDIPFSEFTEIYFSKDEELLAQTVDQTYGTGFYATTLPVFKLVLYGDDEAAESAKDDLIARMEGARERTE